MLVSAGAGARQVQATTVDCGRGPGAARVVKKTQLPLQKTPAGISRPEVTVTRPEPRGPDSDTTRATIARLWAVVPVHCLLSFVGLRFQMLSDTFPACPQDGQSRTRSTGTGWPCLALPGMWSCLPCVRSWDGAAQKTVGRRSSPARASAARPAMQTAHFVYCFHAVNFLATFRSVAAEMYILKRSTWKPDQAHI